MLEINSHKQKPQNIRLNLHNITLPVLHVCVFYLVSLFLTKLEIQSDMEEEENEEDEGSEYEESLDESEEENNEHPAEERGSLESQIAEYEATIKKAFKAKKLIDEANALNELGSKLKETHGCIS